MREEKVRSLDSLRYKLNDGVRLVRRQNDGLVLSKYPFTVRRVRKSALELLELCDGEHTLDEVLSKVSQPVGRKAALSLLERLAADDVVSVEYPEDPDQHPNVSIVVPVRNRAAEIRECLDSLLSLDYPEGKREILVVDDASDDSTPEEVAHFPVKRLSMPQRSGPAACRNKAIEEADGELVAFIDSDCVADPGWLRDLVPCFADPRVGAVGGLVEPFSSDSPIQRYEKVRSPLYQGTKAKEVRPDSSVSYLTTSNLLVRKEVLQEAGDFDESLRFGEDVDLIWRIRDLGYKALYVPRGRVLHRHPGYLGELARRRASYGTSEAPLLQRHQGKGRSIHIPMGLCGLLAMIMVALLTESSIIAGLALVPPSIELWLKGRRLIKAGLPPLPRLLLVATFRTYALVTYDVLRNLSRYWLIPLLLAGLVFHPVLLLVLLVVLLPTLVDFLRLKPDLSFPTFSVFYLLENLSYQVGVIKGCLKHKTLRPLALRIRII